jgi:thiol:disulfide interchange protein
VALRAGFLSRSIVLVGLVLAACGCVQQSESPKPASGGLQAVESLEPVEVEWEEGWEPAVQRAKAEGKAVLVDFSADWCIWCRRLESTTLRDPYVGAFLKEHVVPIRIDVEGVGRATAQEHGVVDLPTVALFTPTGRELGRITGYMSPTSFLARVDEIVGH